MLIESVNGGYAMNERFFSLSKEKQQAIINAGYRVFSQNSYKNSPMSEIAEAAGISKSLLFHYFHNKKELYMFLWDKCADTTICIGLGIAAMMYSLNLIANIADVAEFLKYITPFGYCEGADIVSNGSLDFTLVAIGAVIGIGGIIIAYLKYTKKDIH